MQQQQSLKASFQLYLKEGKAEITTKTGSPSYRFRRFAEFCVTWTRGRTGEHVFRSSPCLLYHLEGSDLCSFQDEVRKDRTSISLRQRNHSCRSARWQICEFVPTVRIFNSPNYPTCVHVTSNNPKVRSAPATSTPRVISWLLQSVRQQTYPGSCFWFCLACLE